MKDDFVIYFQEHYRIPRNIKNCKLNKHAQIFLKFYQHIKIFPLSRILVQFRFGFRQ
jgi:hypothetical protein